MLNFSPDTIAHVQASWVEIEAIAPHLGTRFYDHLFTADPSLVPLFKSNARGEMADQGHKLMQMLGVAVEEMANPEAFADVLEGLGRRHVGYGVQKEHYATVGAALMRTLKEGLGGLFTPPVEQAWTTAYEAMAAVMIGAAEGKAAVSLS